MLYNTKNIKLVESIEINKSNENSKLFNNNNNLEFFKNNMLKLKENTKILINNHIINCQKFLKYFLTELENLILKFEKKENFINLQSLKNNLSFYEKSYDNFSNKILKIENYLKIKINDIDKNKTNLCNTISNNILNKNILINNNINNNNFKGCRENNENYNFLRKISNLSLKYRSKSNKTKNELNSKLIMYKFELLKKMKFKNT